MNKSERVERYTNKRNVHIIKSNVKGETGGFITEEDF